MRSGARFSGLALLACLSLALGACGGGGEGASAPGSTASASDAPISHSSDDSIQTWGHEARSALAERLDAVVHKYLDARAERRWAVVCARLAARQRAEQGLLAGGASCTRAMARFAAHADDGTLRREAAIKPLVARVGPSRGRLYAFVIYRRSGGVWAIALANEAGRWRVVTVTPERLS